MRLSERWIDDGHYFGRNYASIMLQHYGEQTKELIVDNREMKS